MASGFGDPRRLPFSLAVSLPIIQSRMLKKAALSAPVGSEIASCGILSNPDSIASVAQMSTHEPSNQQVVDCQVV